MGKETWVERRFKGIQEIAENIAKIDRAIEFLEGLKAKQEENYQEAVRHLKEDIEVDRFSGRFDEEARQLSMMALKRVETEKDKVGE